MTGRSSKPRVLILYYSFSGQTIGLLRRFADGLREVGVEVVKEKLLPVNPPRFPVGSISATFKMMLTTFLRGRTPIQELSKRCLVDFDLIVLAGPTWSYNPSGPILALLDRDGTRLFKNREVLAMISCRGYWRMHWFGLRRILEKCGATIKGRIVFAHPCPEPWRTIGVFMKIAGKAPENSRIVGRFYKRYGHSKKQQKKAFQFGLTIGKSLMNREALPVINLISMH